jgi:hypothetical protein
VTGELRAIEAWATSRVALLEAALLDAQSASNTLSDDLRAAEEQARTYAQHPKP